MPKKVQFRVLSWSSAEELHSARELEVHSPATKGWSSSRFCLYPQELILRMEQPMRLRKLQLLSHQYLISTKVEIFITDIPPGQSRAVKPSNFKRLGYVGLSKNEGTQFKARELKSVHLDAVGQFVKLVLHKNYVNKYNMYNQVGLVAVNMIGDPLDGSGDRDYLGNVDSILHGYMNPPGSLSNAPLWGKINKPEYLSPMDDLAFDMYQDQETAALIRKLDAKKREAVQVERYDYAKKLHDVMLDLYKVGEKLGRFEAEKRRAVEQENYDLAMEKKRESDDFRLYVYKQLDIRELLELNGTREPRLDEKSPSPLPPLAKQATYRSPQPPPLQEQAYAAHSPAPARPDPSPDKPKSVSPQSPPPKDTTQNEERPLPALQDKSPPAGDDGEQAVDDSGMPEPLRENDLRTAGFVVDVFGEHLVQCAYSKQWKFRQEAMETLRKEMAAPVPELTKDKDPKSVYRAALFLLNKTLKDKVFSVFSECLEALRSLLNTYMIKQKIGKSDLSSVSEKVLPPLLAKSGEMAARTREASINMVIELSASKEVVVHGSFTEQVTQPFRQKHQVPARLYKSRIEIVEKLLATLELDSGKPGSLTTGGIMKLVTPALEHTSGEVRDAAVSLTLQLYKKVNGAVRDHIPPDEPATRKNPLYKKLFDGFDKIDGKPTEAERRAMAKAEKLNSEKEKQAEIAALQAQLQALRDMAGEGSKPKGKTKEEPSAPAPVDVERMCIFCGEQNANFTEDMLDLHYWKSCPMLKRCDHCAQVVEISVLADHFLTECDAKDKFMQCPKCKEALLKVEMDDHLANKSCTASKAGKATNCPLCHKGLGSGDEVWRKHLMDQCGPNKARLQSQQVSKAPSRASLRSNRGRGGKATPLGRGAARGRKGGVMPRA